MASHRPKSWVRWNAYTPERLEEVQDEVLALVADSYKTEEGDAPIKFERIRTEISNGNKIHAIVCEAVRDGAPESEGLPIVFVHGYAAAALFFAGNLAEMALKSKRKVIAMDWLGCGASDRPLWTATDEEQAFDFFLTSFTQWLDALKIERMDLVAHSLGGYLSCFFAMRGGDKYIENLVLASPVGFPEAPTQNARSSIKKKIMISLWKRGMNPNQIIRGAGPFSRRMVDKSILNRFGSKTLDLPGLDHSQHGSLISEYTYLFSAAPPSGEHALSTLLLPGAFARKPLLFEFEHMPDVNMLVVFGEADWMMRDIDAAKEAVRHKRPDTIVVIPGTHHVYLTPEFNPLVLNFFSTTTKDA
mmetsp:Transcript_16779/g.30820  ORF Transcript_16779/g.30820 Transcript_16779/m.30820 type:complete len:359 (+) Transcript_16779:1566-2642(+)